MIRAARSRHRVMVLGLALVVPVLFVAGLVLRQSMPVTEAGRPGGAAGSGEGLELLAEQMAGQGLPIRVGWLRASGAGPHARRAVRLTLEGPLKRPDLLVYWDERPDGTGVPSAVARLLGRVGGRHGVLWEVPQAGAEGRLVFYSSAWEAVIDSMAPPAAWSDTP